MHHRITLAAALCAGACLLACAGGGRPAAGGAGEADRLYAQGRAAFVSGRYDDASGAYRQALLLDPAHLNARNGLAAWHAARGEYGPAIALWRQLVQERRADAAPDNAFLYGNLGYAHWLNGDVDAARDALQQACLLDPLNALSWQRLGLVFDRLGQHERAARMWQQARTLQAHDLKADYAQVADARAAPAPSAASASIVPAATPGPDVPLRRRDPGRGAAGPAPIAAPDGGPASTAAGGPAREAVAASGAAALASASLLVEVRNGNGVRGMAAALGRLIRAPQVRVVRLSNAGSFDVPRTRLEYRPEQARAAKALAARLAIGMVEQPGGGGARALLVLGHDRADLDALRRRYRNPPAQAQAPAGRTEGVVAAGAAPDLIVQRGRAAD